VVGEEVKSKIIRSIDTLRSPKELDEPDILLELNNSYFTPKRHTVSELIKVIYGKDSKIRGTIKRGLLSPLYIIKVDREDLSKAIVIKAFNILWIFKWLMIQLWLIDIKRFTLDSRNRLVNEYLGLIWLRNKLGVNAPKPLLLDWGSGRLVMEYIDGKPLSRYINEDLTISKKYFYQYGRILAGIHNRGYTLGDTKVQNILISNDEIYLIDIEQWSTKPHYAWDISLFIFYTLKFRFRDEGLSELIMRFIDGYIDGGGNPENIRKAVSLRLIRAFMPLVPIHILYKIRRLVTQQF
jgi:Kae1-associated kinase Bud32